MFRCVMPFQLISYAFGFIGRKRLVQTPYSMYVQVTRNQHYSRGIGVVFIHQLLDLVSKTEGSAVFVFSDCCPSPPSQRLTNQQDAGTSSSFVFVVLSAIFG